LSIFVFDLTILPLIQHSYPYHFKDRDPGCTGLIDNGRAIDLRYSLAVKTGLGHFQGSMDMGRPLFYFFLKTLHRLCRKVVNCVLIDSFWRFIPSNHLFHFSHFCLQ